MANYNLTAAFKKRDEEEEARKASSVSVGQTKQGLTTTTRKNNDGSTTATVTSRSGNDYKITFSQPKGLGNPSTAAGMEAYIWQTTKPNSMERNNLYAAMDKAYNTPGSQYYNPYRQATNQGFIDDLALRGIDVTGGINSDFFARNAKYKQLVSDMTSELSGSVTKTGSKKWTNDQWIAYDLYQLEKDEATTQKVEAEWDALQKDIQYYTRKGYTNDEIKKSIDWSNYKTLQKLDENAKLGTPTLLNRATSYSQDAIDGVIWNTRNGRNDDLFTAAVYSQMGSGATDNRNTAARMRRTPGTAEYNPYISGATNDEIRKTFGIESWDMDYLTSKVREVKQSGSEAEQKLLDKMWGIETNTEKAESELEQLQKFMTNADYTQEYYTKALAEGKTARELAEERVKRWFENGDLSTLQKMDEERIHGNYFELSRSVDYRYEDIVDQVEEQIRRAQGVNSKPAENVKKYEENKQQSTTTPAPPTSEATPAPNATPESTTTPSDQTFNKQEYLDSLDKNPSFKPYFIEVESNLSGSLRNAHISAAGNTVSDTGYQGGKDTRYTGRGAALRFQSLDTENVYDTNDMYATLGKIVRGQELTEEEEDIANIFSESLTWAFRATYAGGGLALRDDAYDRRGAYISAGDTAWNVLKSLDSDEAKAKDLQDAYMQLFLDGNEAYKAGQSLEEYYQSNKEEQAEIQAITTRINEAEAAAETARLEKTEADKAANLESMQNLLVRYNAGEELTQGDIMQLATLQPPAEMSFTDMERLDPYLPKIEDDYMLPLYFADKEAKGDAAYTDEVYSAIGTKAMQYYAFDANMAKAAGMTLEEMYAKYPNMQRDFNQVWQEAEQEFLEQANPDNLAEDEKAGLGFWMTVGTGVSLGAQNWWSNTTGAAADVYDLAINLGGAETRSNTYQSYLERNNGNAIAARRSYRTDLNTYIASLREEGNDAKADMYAQALAEADANDQDIFSIPVDLTYEQIEDLHDKQQANINETRQFIQENATAGEARWINDISSATNSIIGMAVSSLVTAGVGGALGTGASFAARAAGTSLGFGVQSFDSSYREFYEATGDKSGAAMYGFVMSAVEMLTEADQLSKYYNIGGNALSSLVKDKLMKEYATGGLKGFAKYLAGSYLANGIEEVGQEIGQNLISSGVSNLAYGLEGGTVNNGWDALGAVSSGMLDSITDLEELRSTVVSTLLSVGMSTTATTGIRKGVEFYKTDKARKILEGALAGPESQQGYDALMNNPEVQQYPPQEEATPIAQEDTAPVPQEETTPVTDHERILKGDITEEDFDFNDEDEIKTAYGEWRDNVADSRARLEELRGQEEQSMLELMDAVNEGNPDAIAAATEKHNAAVNEVNAFETELTNLESNKPKGNYGDEGILLERRVRVSEWEDKVRDLREQIKNAEQTAIDSALNGNPNQEAADQIGVLRSELESAKQSLESEREALEDYESGLDLDQDVTDVEEDTFDETQVSGGEQLELDLSGADYINEETPPKKKRGRPKKAVEATEKTVAPEEPAIPEEVAAEAQKDILKEDPAPVAKAKNMNTRFTEAVENSDQLAALKGAYKELSATDKKTVRSLSEEELKAFITSLGEVVDVEGIKESLKNFVGELKAKVTEAVQAAPEEPATVEPPAPVLPEQPAAVGEPVAVEQPVEQEQPAAVIAEQPVAVEPQAPVAVEAPAPVGEPAAVEQTTEQTSPAEVIAEKPVEKEPVAVKPTTAEPLPAGIDFTKPFTANLENLTKLQERMAQAMENAHNSKGKAAHAFLKQIIPAMERVHDVRVALGDVGEVNMPDFAKLYANAKTSSEMKSVASDLIKAYKSTMTWLDTEIAYLQNDLPGKTDKVLSAFYGSKNVKEMLKRAKADESVAQKIAAGRLNDPAIRDIAGRIAEAEKPLEKARAKLERVRDELNPLLKKRDVLEKERAKIVQEMRDSSEAAKNGQPVDPNLGKRLAEFNAKMGPFYERINTLSDTEEELLADVESMEGAINDDRLEMNNLLKNILAELRKEAQTEADAQVEKEAESVAFTVEPEVEVPAVNETIATAEETMDWLQRDRARDTIIEHVNLLHEQLKLEAKEVQQKPISTQKVNAFINYITGKSKKGSLIASDAVIQAVADLNETGLRNLLSEVGKAKNLGAIPSIVGKTLNIEAPVTQAYSAPKTTEPKISHAFGVLPKINTKNTGTLNESAQTTVEALAEALGMHNDHRMKKYLRQARKISNGYTYNLGITHVQLAQNIQTAMHEINHNLDVRLGMQEWVSDWSALRSNYEKYVNPTFIGQYDSKGEAVVHEELMAEFGRVWANNRDTAVLVAGEDFVKKYEEALKKRGWLDAMRKAATNLQLWENASSVEKTKAMIDLELPDTKKKFSLEGFATEYLDYTRPLVKVTSAMRKLLGDHFDPSMDTRTLMLAKENTIGKQMDMILYDHMVDREGNPVIDTRLYDSSGMLNVHYNEPVGSLREILERLGPEREADLNALFVSYLHLERERFDKGVLTPQTPRTPGIDAVENIKRITTEHPEVARAVEDIVNWYDLFMRTWMVGNIIPEKLYKKLRKMYPHYVPTVRSEYIKEGTAGQYGSRRGDKNPANVLRRAGKADANIYNPIMGLTENIQRYVATVRDIEIRRAFAYQMKLARENGLQEISGIAEPAQKDIVMKDHSDIKNLVLQALKADDLATPDAAIKVIENMDFTTFLAKDATGNDVISVPYVTPQGVEVESWTVYSPEIYNALTMMPEAQQAKTIKAYARLTRFLCANATSRNIAFGVQNMFSDAASAADTGRNGNDSLKQEISRSLPVYFARQLKAAFDLAVNKAGDTDLGKKLGIDKTNAYTNTRHTYELFSQFGALGSRYALRNQDTQSEIRRKLYGGKRSTSERVKTIATAPIRGIEWITGFGEEMTRYNEFSNSGFDMSNYGEVLAAAQNSREATTDFTKHGASQSDMKFLKATIPFFGAQAQGLYKTARLFSEENAGDRTRIAARIAINSLLKGAVLGLIRRFTWDDEDKEAYDKISAYERSRYDHIKLPSGTFIRVKKSQDALIQIMDAAGNALGQTFTGYEDDVFGDFMNLAMNCAGNVLLSFDTIATPVIDALNNRTWYGGAIDSYRQTTQSVENRYDENTTKTARSFSSILQALGVDLSPGGVEYVVKQFTGSLGTLSFGVLEQFQENGFSEKAAKGIWDILIDTTAGKFSIDPVYSNDITSSFYNSKTTLTEAKSDVGNGKSPGIFRNDLTQEEANQAYKELDAMLTKGGLIYEANKELARLWNEHDKAGADENLTDDQKLERQRAIREEINRVGLSANSEIATFMDKYCYKNMAERTIGNVVNTWTNEKVVPVKPDNYTELDDAFVAEADEQYMQRATELYEKGLGDTVVPHPPHSFEKTMDLGQGKEKVTIEVDDDSWDKFVFEYMEAYKADLLKDDDYMYRWDELSDAAKKKIYTDAHTKALGAAKEWYLDNVYIR